MFCLVVEANICIDYFLEIKILRPWQTLSTVLVKCVLRAQELCPPVCSPSLGHCSGILCCAQRVCKQNTDKWKEKGSWDMQNTRLSTRMLSTPDKRIQGGSVGLHFSLELAHHQSCWISVCWLPDFISYSSIPFQVNVFALEFSGYLLPLSQPS